MAAAVPAPDPRHPRDQIMDATGDNVEMLGELASLFPESGTVPSEPTSLAGWLMLALCKFFASKVTIQRIRGMKVNFEMPDKSKRVMFASFVKIDSSEYVPMVEHLAAQLVALEALPAGETSLGAEQTLTDFLDHYSGGSTPIAKLGKRKVEEDEKSTKPSREYTCADFVEASRLLRELNYPVEKGDMCKYSEMTKARDAMLAKSQGVATPLLPYLPQTQPAALHCCVTEGGEIAEDAMRHWKIDAGQLVQDEAVVSKKKDRSVHEVAHGYIMYWHIVLVYSAQIEGLGPQYATRVPGWFLSPLALVKFCNLLRRTVGGRSPPTASQLDGLLAPMLRYVQEMVNEALGKPWSGDEALEYMCARLVEGLNLQRAMMRTGANPGGDGNKGKQNTPKKVGNAPKACIKCATGKTNHHSGICLVCKSKGEALRAAKGGLPP